MSETGASVKSSDDSTFAFWTMAPLHRRFPNAAGFVAIFAASLMLDLAIGLFYRFRTSPIQLEADEREYYDIAMGILSGQVSFTPRRSLGFPVLEAGIKALTNNFIVLQSSIAAIYSLAAPLLFLLVKKLTGDARIAAGSAIALMLWPPAIYYGLSLYSEAVALPLFLLSLVLIPAGSRIRPVAERGVLLAIAGGVCLGITTHVRPMYLLSLPVILLILLIEDNRLIVAVQRFALVVAGFGLVIAPWSVFMSARYHHLILVTSNGGETLAGGLTPELLKMNGRRHIQLIDRVTWEGPGKWLPIDRNGYLTKVELALPYDRQDALLTARTIDWAEQHPLEAASLELSKVRYLWGFSGIAENDPYQTIFGAVPTILLLLCGAIALWRMSPAQRWQYPRLWLLPLFVSGVSLISWGSWRFRQAGDAGLIALSVIGVGLLVGRWFHRSCTSSRK